jgi:hypothetical protein
VQKTEPLAEFVASFGVQSLPDSLELFDLNRTLEPEFFRADAEPLAGDFLALGVIVFLLQISRDIALSVPQDSIREHDKMMLRQRN